jgi:hypothetical protein
VHDGQTVLYIAEKMAALNVVYDRLDRVGLDDICLELHSRAANKRLVAERLDHTLQAAAGSSATNETAKQLTAARDRLNHAAKRLHAQIGNTAMTPYRALSIQIAAARHGFTPAARLVEEAAPWTGKEFAEKARLIERLAGLTESVGPLNSDAYVGVRRRCALQPADFQRQIPKLQALLGAGPPGEVACHGAQAAPSRCGRLTHAEAAVAAGLMQSRARCDKPCQATLPNQLLERLARSRVDVERDARSDPPARNHRRNHRGIAIAGIGRGSE